MGVEYIKVQQHESSVYQDLPAPRSSIIICRLFVPPGSSVELAIFSLPLLFPLLCSHTTSPMILAASL